MKQNRLFELFWKANYSISKQTIDDVLTRIDKEIDYLSTVVVPRSNNWSVRKVLKQIEFLSAQRNGLLKKLKSYDEERNPRAVREVMQPGILGTESSETKKEETCSEEKTYGVKPGGRINLSQVSKEEIKDQVVNEALILLLGAKRSYGVSIARGNAISALRAVDKEGKYEDEWNKMADWIVNEFKNANKSQIHKEMLFDKKQILKDLYCKMFGSTSGLKIDDLDELELDTAIESLQKIFDKGR